MKKTYSLYVMAMLGVILALGLVLMGCAMNADDEEEEKVKEMKAGIPLTLDTWADGAVSASNDNEQWFQFTATASTQYIHVLFGTMTNMNVGLYDRNGNALGNSLHFYRSSNTNENESILVTSGQMYYLRVTPGTGSTNGYPVSNTGTFRIAFNAMQWSPGTITSAATLSADTWADGVIISSDDEQWFKFTATASSQYIHVRYGTMNNLDVGLYDSNGNALGNSIQFAGDSNTNKNNLTMVTSGQMYYLRVTPGTNNTYWYSKSGTYRIGFNTSETAPE
ncbi:MAG: hypothetical protein LBS97_03105 [Treponema sp.]|jgi:hypothetical protein|nr:hypothetical protein [Treponema sp.]